MKRCLICAGLVAALLGSDFGDAVPRAEAQIVAPPTGPNGLTLQQKKRLRPMMRLRCHQRHRHKLPITPGTPTTSMVPGPIVPNPAMLNAMMVSQLTPRHRRHHHRHHRHQLLMAQLLMRQMLMNQMIQYQMVQNSHVATPQNRIPANPNKSLTAQRKTQIAAQIRRASF